LCAETATALFGGASLYLLGHAAFHRRCTGNIKPQRLATGVVLALLIPLGTAIDALPSQVVVTAVVVAVIAYEHVHYGESRRQIRSELARGRSPAD
jgi:low temperature requirement protein LtrA